MADMGNRMLELLDGHEMKVFVLNTGRVGGGDGDERSKKVKIPHSSAIVQAIVEDTIEWEHGPRLRLRDRRVAARHRRRRDPPAPAGCTSARAGSTSTTRWSARMKNERREYLASFAGLDEAIVKSIR